MAEDEAAAPTKLALTAELVGKSLSLLEARENGNVGYSKLALANVDLTKGEIFTQYAEGLKYLACTQATFSPLPALSAHLLAPLTALLWLDLSGAEVEKAEEAPAAEPAEGGGEEGGGEEGGEAPAAPPPQIAPWASSFAFPALQVLALKECGLASLAGCAWDLPALTSLDLGGNALPTLAGLATLPKLAHLSVKGNVPLADVGALGTACPVLSSLYADECPELSGPEALAAVAPTLRELTGLADAERAEVVSYLMGLTLLNGEAPTEEESGEAAAKAAARAAAPESPEEAAEEAA